MKKCQLILSIFGLLLSIPSFAQSNAEYEQKTIYTNNVYFDFGKFELRPEAIDSLQQLIQFIQQKENINIRISAHTDAIGSNKNNEILSENRANAVLNYLVKNGVQQEWITKSQHGEYIPVAENNTNDGRQLNRRASIDVIQSIPLVPQVSISGTIKDEATNEGLKGKVIYRSKNLKDSVMTNAKGEYRFSVPDSTIIGLDYVVKGYFFETKMLKAIKGNLKPLEIKIKKAECGAKIALKNMYFYGDQSKLLPKSKPGLLRVLKFMQYNPNVTIEVGGHVNEPNRTVEQCSLFGKTLSVNRARVIYDYLITNKIDSSRVSYKGYANSQMIYPKTRLESEMKMNRRVEIKVICKNEDDTVIE